MAPLGCRCECSPRCPGSGRDARSSGLCAAQPVPVRPAGTGSTSGFESCTASVRFAWSKSASRVVETTSTGPGRVPADDPVARARRDRERRLAQPHARRLGPVVGKRECECERGALVPRAGALRPGADPGGLVQPVVRVAPDDQAPEPRGPVRAPQGQAGLVSDDGGVPERRRRHHPVEQEIARRVAQSSLAVDLEIRCGQAVGRNGMVERHLTRDRRVPVVQRARRPPPRRPGASPKSKACAAT